MLFHSLYLVSRHGRTFAELLLNRFFCLPDAVLAFGRPFHHVTTGLLSLITRKLYIKMAA
jgi:hypothetical protein